MGYFEVKGKHENVCGGFSWKLSSGNRPYAITIDLFIDVLFDDSMNFKNLSLMPNCCFIAVVLKLLENS